MKESEMYGGSDKERRSSKKVQELRKKALTNGYTVRREKRGNQTIIIITPKEETK